jgi:hypothetical protein
MMASVPVEKANGVRAGELLVACVTEQGSASHPYLRSDELLKSSHTSRNLADLIHFLCALHGRYPGVIDDAAHRTVEPLARPWFGQAIEAFAIERNFLARLAVAVGPLPSTPGASDNDAVLRGQRHAITMLSQSDRGGCALGAAMAMVIDWIAIRPALDATASRFGVEVPLCRLIDVQAVRTVADNLEGNPGLRRAMMFGAEQIALQHRGLCDLLDARQQARGIY